eukprot:Lankesteria_metandrocarpae@DN329_c0_g1_i1.p1
MHTIKVRASTEPDVHITDLLRESTLAFNATPKTVTGSSPFFMITGMEMRLPGLSQYMHSMPEELRKKQMKYKRLEMAIHAQIRQEDFVETTIDQLQEGDIVLRLLSDHERQRHFGVSSSASLRFVPKWSLPSKVVKVLHDGQAVMVKGLWDNYEVNAVQVSVRNVKRFVTEIPRVFQQHLLHTLQVERPLRRARATSMIRQGGEAVPLVEATIGGAAYAKSHPSELPSGKRRREKLLD